MIEAELIRRHSTSSDFSVEYDRWRDSEKVGFVCSYVNPYTRCCQILLCPEQEKLRVKLEERGYMLADYEMYNRKTPGVKDNYVANFRNS